MVGRIEFNSMKRGIIYILPFLLLFQLSCKNRHTYKEQEENLPAEAVTKEFSFYVDTSNQDIIALTAKVSAFLQQCQHGVVDFNTKDTLLKEALVILDYAIKTDSGFTDAYLNKSAVYRELNQYDMALSTLEDLLQIKNNPEAIFLVGLIYEKQGNLDRAQSHYNEALKAYDVYLKTPLATARDEMNRDNVLLFLEGKEEVLDRINEELSRSPGNTTLLADKQSVQQFNRERFFEDF